MTLALDDRRRAMLAEMGVSTAWLRDVPVEALADAPYVEPAAVRTETSNRVAAAPAPVLDDRRAAPVAAADPADGPVFGAGDPHPDWLILGEALADEGGEPALAQAAKLLDNMLRAVGVARGRKVYIADVLKCRAAGTRSAQTNDAAECERLLRQEIDRLQPKVIVAMDRFAVQALLQSQEPMGKLRGRAHSYMGIPLVVTYHPSYLLRNLPEKAKAWADLCLAQQLMRGA